MTESFRVGEIAIIVNAKQKHWNGAEVTIMSPLQHHPGRTPRYEISPLEPDGLPCYAPPQNLRKRRPPQDWVKLCNLTDLPREVVHV